MSLVICDTAFAVMVRHYIVKGRVQGVGFRWFVQREAYEIGLRGWVRNTSDGDVEVLAAGSEEQIREPARGPGTRFARLSSGRHRAPPPAGSRGREACRHLKLREHGERASLAKPSKPIFSSRYSHKTRYSSDTLETTNPKENCSACRNCILIVSH